MLIVTYCISQQLMTSEIKFNRNRRKFILINRIQNQNTDWLFTSLGFKFGL